MTDIRLLAVCLIVLVQLPAEAENQLLWGDTHVHTSFSTDSFINQNFTLGPAEAYRFAAGLPIVNPYTQTRVQIQTPLDFLVVSDHAESFGAMRWANEKSYPRDGLGPVDWLNSWFKEKLFRYLATKPDSVVDLLKYASSGTDNVIEAAKTPAAIGLPNGDIVARESWRESIAISDAHNRPGEFTSLIGWEWSSIPAGANLHRVVFTASDASVAGQFVPFSSSVSSYPEDLWQWLNKTSDETGADFVAIPHNSNISRGFMFPTERRLRDTPLDRDWAALRARWEPVVEATQVKGDSETDPAVSPEDSFADFETYPHYIHPDPLPYTPGPGDYVRSALRSGLLLEKKLGINPYHFGVIGSTDSHTGMANAEEPNFWGKFLTDSTIDGKTRETSSIDNFGWAMSASGLAAVWAEDNTREAIFAAFKRREVYGTTGPRIAVRVHVLTADDAPPPPEQFLEAGIPMGGELQTLAAAPWMYVQAQSDPASAYLDRIQVVKGWLEGEQTHEKIYDVAWSGDRTPGADGSVPKVPDTVDLATGSYSNQYGAATLSVTWRDPDFNPAQRAFYYVRVLEIPTPRHSTLDAIAMGRDVASTRQAATIQERAYTSAIHYRP